MEALGCPQPVWQMEVSGLHLRWCNLTAPGQSQTQAPVLLHYLPGSKPWLDNLPMSQKPSPVCLLSTESAHQWDLDPAPLRVTALYPALRGLLTEEMTDINLIKRSARSSSCPRHLPATAG